MECWSQLLASTAYVAVSVLVGCLAASVANNTELFLKLSKLLRLPLNPHLSYVPLLACLSPRAAHIAASRKLLQGLVKPRDVYLAIMASAPAARLSLALRLYVPVLVPLLGLTAIKYLALRSILDILMLIIAMALGSRRAGHFKLGADYEIPSNGSPGLARDFLSCMRSTGLRVIAAYVVALAASYIVTGVVSRSLWQCTPLSGLGLLYLLTAIVSPRAAYGVAKLMLDYGYPEEAVVGFMMLGSSLHLAVNESWTRLLPLYLALYPRPVAFKLMVIQALIPSAYSAAVGLLLLCSAPQT